MMVLDSGPTCRDLRYIGDDIVMSIDIEYQFYQTRFFVLVSAEKHEISPGYDLSRSIEGKYLIELSDLTWGDCSDEKDSRIDHLQTELCRIIGDACAPMMLQLAPCEHSTGSAQRALTLQEHFYPEKHVLQAHAEGERIICKKLDDDHVTERHPPVPQARLQQIGLTDDDKIPVPVVKASQYHNLRALLDGVADGRFPETAATAVMRSKWARKIRETVTELHKLDILWHNVKTDNVLIDDQDDAVVLDFSGGNTVGWVDEHKIGTMEGDLQALQKILDALGL